MLNIFKYFKCFFLIVALLTTVGCVTKTDVETLQMQGQQDRNRIKQLEAELEESRQLLKEEIERSQSPVRQRAADMWAELQSLRSAFAKLRGEVETLGLRMDRQVGPVDSEVSVATLDEQLREIEFILENQLQVDMPRVRQERAALMQAAVAATVEGNATEGVVVEGLEQSADAESVHQAAQKVEDTDPAKALYDKAYALYKDGQYERARSFWAEFTDTFKGHPFSASAFFWQGQSYFKLNDYARAVILYEDVIERYKKSSKYKSALLKAGYSWNNLDKPELAKMRLQEVVDKFPKSVEATQAKRFLEKLN